jgi:ankyrin repeat protein
VQRLIESPHQADPSPGEITSLPQDESILEELQEEQLSEVVLERLQQDASLLNAQHPALGTALHVAVENGAPQAVEILLELGVDRNTKDHQALLPLEKFNRKYANATTRKEGTLNKFQLYVEDISQILTAR